MNNKFDISLIEDAIKRLTGVVSTTPLQFSERLSAKYEAKIYLKREDLQVVRSYKLRGAYNKISTLTDTERQKGIVTASAGNHAQGVAFACGALKIKGRVYMPTGTPRQKINRVKTLGKEWIEIVLIGDTYDETSVEAMKYSEDNNATFVPPFNDIHVIAGQGTVAVEVCNQLGSIPDVFVVPVGGGGLLAGTGSYLSAKNPSIKIIAAEPAGAPSMDHALNSGIATALAHIDKFVDGAAVKKVGDLTFSIAKDFISKMILVPEGKICKEMIELYQEDGIIVEPAGALSISALDDIAEDIKGKTVVCVVSGGNNDILRYPEILERSLIYQGLKHYFIVELPQRPGALRDYVNSVLGEGDNITFFEYVKRNNKERGPIFIGIEVEKKGDIVGLLSRMKEADIVFEEVTSDSPLFGLII